MTRENTNKADKKLINNGLPEAPTLCKALTGNFCDDILKASICTTTCKKSGGQWDGNWSTPDTGIYRANYSNCQCVFSKKNPFSGILKDPRLEGLSAYFNQVPDYPAKNAGLVK
jgi:hypothetical protein